MSVSVLLENAFVLHPKSTLYPMPELTHKDVLMQPVLTLHLVELIIQAVRIRPGLSRGICQPTFRLNPGNLKEHCVIFGDLGNHKSN